ncbi:MAG: hypothetical protein A2104_09560 [Candidatus Melainabacteria bacterium GWF2_32_7]|nr:MAG: hypothetical protein A2104_09560 [Candidatus Melainabacteria bacterium GWF2_32_7]
MPKEEEKKGAKFKAGIFIIVTLALLIFSILWLRYFAVRPVMTVCARFTDPGPISTGLPIYYQGVNIGEISKIGFSEDYRYTIVCMDIYKENIKLPKNVYAQVRQEGITGQKYISIMYPKNPTSPCLADGDCIEGRSPFGIEDLQAFFEKQVESGRLDRIFINLEQTLANANQTSKRLDRMSITVNNLLQANKEEINDFFKHGSQAASDISDISGTISNFIGDQELEGNLRGTVASISEAARSFEELMADPQVRGNVRQVATNINEITRNVNDILADTEIRQGIRSTFGGIARLLGTADAAIEGFEAGGAAPIGLGITINNLNALLKDMGELISNINCYTGDIYSDVKQTGLIPNASAALYEATRTFGRAQNVFGRTEEVLGRLGETEFDRDTTGLIINTIQNTNQAVQSHNQAAKQVDCLAEGVSEMLSKRFLLLRLLFGKPGAALEECEELEQYLDDKNKEKTKQPCPVQVAPISPKPCPTGQIIQPISPRSEMKQQVPEPKQHVSLMPQTKEQQEKIITPPYQVPFGSCLAPVGPISDPVIPE